MQEKICLNCNDTINVGIYCNNCQDWINLNKKLERKTYIGEFIIQNIKENGIKTNKYLNISSGSIGLSEFKLEEKLEDYWIKKLENDIRGIEQYGRIGIKQIYVVPEKICGEYPTPGMDKDDMFAYFPINYIYHKEMHLHFWHENLHGLIPQKKFKDNTEEYVVRKMTVPIGKCLFGNKWIPERSIACCTISDLKWNTEDALGIINGLEGSVEQCILNETKLSL